MKVSRDGYSRVTESGGGEGKYKMPNVSFAKKICRTIIFESIRKAKLTAAKGTLVLFLFSKLVTKCMFRIRRTPESTSVNPKFGLFH